MDLAIIIKRFSIGLVLWLECSANYKFMGNLLQQLLGFCKMSSGSEKAQTWCGDCLDH